MINFTDVDKNFGTQVILSKASFAIYPKERVGLVGPNGAGKSTIFNLLMREISQDAGEVNTPENLRISYVRQQTKSTSSDISVLDYAEDAIPELKIIEKRLHEIEHLLTVNESNNKYLSELGELQTKYEELGGYTLRSQAEAVLCGLGFRAEQLSQPFRTFSGGWKIRCELARNLVANPDILLLDEPTNYLDLPAIEWLQDFLKKFQGTLLLISHDRYLLNLLTSKTIEVANGRTTTYAGNYQYYVTERELRYEQMLSTQKNQEKQVEKIEQFVERFRYKASKSNQVQSRIKQLEKMDVVQAVDPNIIKAAKITLPTPPPCGNEIWRCRDFSFGYSNKPLLYNNLELSIQKGDKIGVVGLNGLGKTTLLRLVIGALVNTEGKSEIGSNVMIGYQGQDYSEVMDPLSTVFEIAKKAANGIRKEAEVRSILGSFRFSGNAIDKQVQVLSGGEKVRLALARLLLSPCNFVVLDEPTTHLDIGTREALEDAMTNYSGTVLFVSHDTTFVRKVATTIWEVSTKGVTKFYGNYDYYLEKLAQLNQLNITNNISTDKKQAPLVVKEEVKSGNNDKQRKREQAELRQEWSRKRKPLEEKLQKTEDKIIAMEEEQEQLLSQFSDPNFKLSEEQAKRLGELKSEILKTNGVWEELANELEELQEFYKSQLEDKE